MKLVTYVNWKYEIGTLSAPIRLGLGKYFVIDYAHKFVFEPPTLSWLQHVLLHVIELTHWNVLEKCQCFLVS